MKQRNLLKVFLLSIITLGIYYIYWLYATRKEILAHGGPSVPPVLMLFLSPLIILAAFLVYAVANSLIGSSDASASALNIALFATLIVSMIAWPIISIWWTWQYSIAVEVITKHHLSRDLVFWVWLLLILIGSPIIWLLMIQNEFNHLAPKSRS